MQPAIAWFVDTFMNQAHISYQLQKRWICFPHNMKSSKNKTVLTCYRNTLKNANTSIRHNIACLRNPFGIDIDSSETTLVINLYLTNKQLASLSNLKMFLAVRNKDITIPNCLSFYKIECLNKNIVTL